MNQNQQFDFDEFWNEGQDETPAKPSVPESKPDAPTVADKIYEINKREIEKDPNYNDGEYSSF